jgi:DNA-binding beta-propeller fold protein YncE
VWDFGARKILRTVELPGAGGTIDVRLIPGDPGRRAYTAGMIDDKLYLIDTGKGTASAVFDFASIAKGGWPQLMRTTADGKRLFVSMNMAGKVVMFDTTRPDSPTVLAVLDLGKGSGPHYIALTRDEKRLVVSDYFLNEDGAGKVHAEGDHKVHVANVTATGLALDPKFKLDMNTASPSGPARPHGLAFK